jgi:hypothetical protein
LETLAAMRYPEWGHSRRSGGAPITSDHSLSAHRIEQCGSITAGFGELKEGRDHG